MTRLPRAVAWNAAPAGKRSSDTVTVVRHLAWDGCFNVRDLGGLPAVDGRWTRWRAVVRADALDGLSEAGWRALVEYGVRTVIDLRNDDERRPDAARHPRGVQMLRIPLDGAQDREFWDVWRSGPQFGTPLYYGPHIQRFTERNAAVVAAIADAPSGGVVFHLWQRPRSSGASGDARARCRGSPGGSDRRRLCAQLRAARRTLRGAPRARSRAAITGLPRPAGTTAEQTIVELLTRIDVAQVLRGAGLTDLQIERLRGRLLGAA